MESSRSAGSVRALRFLPLTTLAFYVLLVLAEAPGHGYALVRRIRERSDGLVDPGTGSFYTIIQGFADAGLIKEDRSAGGSDGSRRQFAITTLGRDVLAAEARRLKDLAASTQHVLGRTAPKRG
jgi:DNA-binding PadR family transcriptional regulator